MTADLEALAEKYREMIALRRAPEPKDAARLKALAARFPGALRELDTRTMASLEERLAELESGTAPAWASAQIRFHGWLRVAIRMRADGANDVPAARRWALAYVPGDVGDPDRAQLEAALAVLVAPPGGRVSLAARALLGDVREDLDVLLFGARR